jgi:hydroxymethylpyrimidine pyrophosphatase-like HAD family hydrolase
MASLLVTGRVLEEVQRACEDLSPFDAVIAENGAVVHLCGLGRTMQIGRPPSELENDAGRRNSLLHGDPRPH